MKYKIILSIGSILFLGACDPAPQATFRFFGPKSVIHLDSNGEVWMIDPPGAVSPLSKTARAINVEPQYVRKMKPTVEDQCTLTSQQIDVLSRNFSTLSRPPNNPKWHTRVNKQSEIILLGDDGGIPVGKKQGSYYLLKKDLTPWFSEMYGECLLEMGGETTNKGLE